MSIGRLIVEFEARTGKFETDTGRASKIMERRAREIEKQVSKIATVAVAAFTATAGAVAVLVNNSIDAADELSKMSQKVGIATDELSKYAYAAKLADVDTESLSTSLAKLAKVAVDPSKEAAAAFDALGVSIKNADGQVKSTGQLLEDLSEAFSKFADGPEKTAAAIAIFGRSGAELIPLLNGGKQAIKEAGDELERFGGVVTPEAGRQAEAFNDNLTRLKTAVDGVGNQVATNLLKNLVSLTDKFVGTAKEGEKVQKVADEITKAVQSMALGLAIAGEGIAVFVRLIRAVVGSFEAVFADIALLAEFLGRGGPLGLALEDNRKALSQSLDQRNAIVSKANQRWSDLWNENATVVSDSLRRSFDAQKGYVDQTKALIDGATGLGQSGIPFRPGMEPVAQDQPIPFRPGKGPQTPRLQFNPDTDKTTASIKAQTKAVDEWATSLESAGAIADEVKRMEEERNRIMEEGKSLTESLRSPNEEYAAGIQRLNELLAAGAINQETYNRAVFGLQDALDQTTQGIEKVGKTSNDTFEDMSKFAERAAENMQDAFADFLFDPFKDGLSGMLSSFADTLQRMAAQAAAAEIFNFFKSTGSSGFVETALGWLGGLGGGAPIRDSGGSGMPGQPYLIGRGAQPELFVPDTAGTFYPRDEWMGGGMTVSQNITVQAPAGTVSRQTLQQVGAEAARGLRTAGARGN